MPFRMLFCATGQQSELQCLRTVCPTMHSVFCCRAFWCQLYRKERASASACVTLLSLKPCRKQARIPTLPMQVNSFVACFSHVSCSLLPHPLTHSLTHSLNRPPICSFMFPFLSWSRLHLGSLHLSMAKITIRTGAGAELSFHHLMHLNMLRLNAQTQCSGSKVDIFCL